MRGSGDEQGACHRGVWRRCSCRWIESEIDLFFLSTTVTFDPAQDVDGATVVDGDGASGLLSENARLSTEPDQLQWFAVMCIVVRQNGQMTTFVELGYKTNFVGSM